MALPQKLLQSLRWYQGQGASPDQLKAGWEDDAAVTTQRCRHGMHWMGGALVGQQAPLKAESRALPTAMLLRLLSSLHEVWLTGSATPP
jgi:hypothetical protein